MLIMVFQLRDYSLSIVERVGSKLRCSSKLVFEIGIWYLALISENKFMVFGIRYLKFMLWVVFPLWLLIVLNGNNNSSADKSNTLNRLEFKQSANRLPKSCLLKIFGVRRSAREVRRARRRGNLAQRAFAVWEFKHWICQPTSTI